VETPLGLAALGAAIASHFAPRTQQLERVTITGQRSVPNPAAGMPIGSGLPFGGPRIARSPLAVPTLSMGPSLPARAAIPAAVLAGRPCVSSWVSAAGCAAGAAALYMAVSPEARENLKRAITETVTSLAEQVGGDEEQSGEQAASAQGEGGAGKKTCPNPDGCKGKQDHRDKVGELADRARGEAKPGEQVLEGKNVRGHDSTRKPDVQIVDENGRTRQIYEAERRPGSARNKARGAEYDSLGIPHKTFPLK
jgi:hypothetical protein